MDWLEHLGMGAAESLHAAGMLIVNDLSRSTPDMLHWFAIMKGMWMITPSMITNPTASACLKYEPALAVRRKVWVSTNCRFEASDWWESICKELERSTQDTKWALLPSRRSFLAAYKGETCCCGVVTELDYDNNPDLRENRHVFLIHDFVNFVMKLSLGSSLSGTCGQ